MNINIHLAFDWVGISFKNYRKIFPRPLNYKSITDMLREWHCPMRVKAVCIVYSKYTAIRIAPVPNEKITAEWVHAHFPYGEKFNISTHVFSHEIFKSAFVFMAALPFSILDDACGVCEHLGIKKVNIKQIDVIERCVFMKHIGSSYRQWVCFPLDNGLRILSLSGGLPENSYFISNDPNYREAELALIALPDNAVIFDGCNWFSLVLDKSGAKLINGGGVFETV